MKLSDYKNIKYINTQISDFCKIRNGYSFKSNLYSKSGIRVIRISDVQKGSISDNDIVFYPLNFKNEFENYLLTEKDILVSLTGNVGRVAMLKISNLPAALNQRVAAISTNSNVINKYLYYCISNDKFENQCYEASTGGAQKNLSTKWLANYVVPIPEIKVQEEIVKILDSFTNLIDALNEELSLRQKQFDYYREKLLTFDDDVEKFIVTEVAQLKSGLTYKPSDVSDKGILVLRSSNIKNGFLSYDDNVFVKESTKISDRSIVRCNDILICVRNGSKKLVGKCAMIDKNADGMAFGAFMSVLRAKDINPKYLFYVWSSQIIQDKIKGDDAAPINQITSKDFNRLLIPVPKEQIQQSIVEKLDAFESLISSLKEEIALRQKQYEYYREKLLTFN